MSIAVSVPLAPSRLLRQLLAAFCALSLAMAGAAASGVLGPLRWPALSVLACLLAALALGMRLRARPTVRQLDVLGPGRLVLTVQQGVGPAMRMPVRLLAASTLWPQLLVLRLGDGGAVIELVVLADSVPAAQFRRLAMALRAVASRAA